MQIPKDRSSYSAILCDMVPTAQKPGLNINPGQEKKKEKKKIPAAFAKYKFYLDIKASKVKSTLLEDITALGGVSLVQFRSSNKSGNSPQILHLKCASKDFDPRF